MDAMKNYFKYAGMTDCGIPNIILEGSIEDWTKIINAINNNSQIFSVYY